MLQLLEQENLSIRQIRRRISYNVTTLQKRFIIFKIYVHSLYIKMKSWQYA